LGRRSGQKHLAAPDRHPGQTDSRKIQIDGHNVMSFEESRLAAFAIRPSALSFKFHHLLPEFTLWKMS
jgi:hypothetical protein